MFQKSIVFKCTSFSLAPKRNRTLTCPMAMLLVSQRASRVCAFSRHLSQSPLTLPIIRPVAYNKFLSDMSENEELTKICQSMRSMERVRICDDPVMEACHTTSGQSLLGDTFCSDVLFIRSFYEKLFQIVRHNRRVILIGNPGISKSV